MVEELLSRRGDLQNFSRETLDIVGRDTIRKVAGYAREQGIDVQMFTQNFLSFVNECFQPADQLEELLETGIDLCNDPDELRHLAARWISWDRKTYGVDLIPYLEAQKALSKAISLRKGRPDFKANEEVELEYVLDFYLWGNLDEIIKFEREHAFLHW